MTTLARLKSLVLAANFRHVESRRRRSGDGDGGGDGGSGGGDRARDGMSTRFRKINVARRRREEGEITEKPSEAGEKVKVSLCRGCGGGRCIT